MTSDDAATDLPLDELPEGCMANVLSFTSPQEVGWLSAVSPMFRSAASSDIVWNRFLPADLESILSTTSEGSRLLASGSSKKELYFSLCDSPVLVDNGRKRLSLEKWSGKKCYMLPANDLMITLCDTPEYRKRNSHPAYRFALARVFFVCWLQICGKIRTHFLSPATMYTAYLVFKLSAEAHEVDDQPVEVTMKLDGSEIFAHNTGWNTECSRGRPSHNVVRQFGIFNLSHKRSVPLGESDGCYPRLRRDGWLEIELCKFFNKGGEDEELEIRVFDSTGHWICGLILEGIEIRPKKVSLFHPTAYTNRSARTVPSCQRGVRGVLPCN